MALYMQTTKITVEKTVSEISYLLGYAGATKMMIEWEKKEPVGLSFCVRVNDNGAECPFKLPANVRPVYDILQKQRHSRNRARNEQADMEQAKRTAWRLLLRWVQAQLALIETGMVTIQEVFLPYVLMGDGGTFYQQIAAKQFKQLPLSTSREEK